MGFFNNLGPVGSQALLGFGAGLLGSAPTSGDRVQQGLLGLQQGTQTGNKLLELERQREAQQRRDELASTVAGQYTQTRSAPVPGTQGHPARGGATRQVGLLPQTQNRGLLAAEAIRGGDYKTAHGLLNPEQPEAPSVIRTVRAMGVDPRTPEGRQLIKEFETSGGVTVNNAPDWTPQGYMPRDPGDPSQGVDPIPGSPAAREAQDAARKSQQELQQEHESQQLVNETFSLAGQLLRPEEQGGYRGGLESATGPVGQYVGGLGGEGAAAVTRLDRLRSLLTKDNLSLMSGVLSESDIQILERVSAALDRGQTDDAMVSELQRVFGKFSDKVDWENLPREQILAIAEDQVDFMTPRARKRLEKRMDELGL